MCVCVFVRIFCQWISSEEVDWSELNFRGMLQLDSNRELTISSNVRAIFYVLKTWAGVGGLIFEIMKTLMPQISMKM